MVSMKKRNYYSKYKLLAHPQGLQTVDLRKTRIRTCPLIGKIWFVCDLYELTLKQNTVC